MRDIPEGSEFAALARTRVRSEETVQYTRDNATDLLRCFCKIRKRLGVEPYANSQMEAMMSKALRVDPFVLQSTQRYMV